MTRSLTLTNLDASTVYPGQTAVDSLWTTLRLAPILEQLGYIRYWVTEHYSPRIAHSSPALLLSMLAGVTDSFRVGVAGVLLNLHDPLQVARDFTLLNAMYPGRIDLGIARGADFPPIPQGKPQSTDGSLKFAARVEKLIGLLSGENRTVSPFGVSGPPIWMLGSGRKSAMIAARNQCNFCFANFLAKDSTALYTALDIYRSSLLPNSSAPTPRLSIALAGVCGATEERARTLYREGSPVVLSQAMIASAATWEEYLRDLSDRSGITDFVFMDLCGPLEERVECHTELASIII